MMFVLGLILDDVIANKSKTDFIDAANQRIETGR